MNGSCGNRKRGCEIDYSLPHDRVIKPFSTEMLRDRNDIQKILLDAGFYLYASVEEKGSLEKMGIETSRVMSIL